MFVFIGNLSIFLSFLFYQLQTFKIINSFIGPVTLACFRVSFFPLNALFSQKAWVGEKNQGLGKFN